MYTELVLPAAFILLLAYYTYRLQMSIRNMPPGPFVMPVFGSIPAIWLRNPVMRLGKIRPWEFLDLLSKEFGDLFSFTFLNYNFVVLASYEILEEVATLEEYNGKFAHEFITYPMSFGKELGIIFVNSTPLWKEMRKFTVRTLREFGFGKLYTMHSVIIDEVNDLMLEFKKKLIINGGVVQFHNTFSLSVLNVLWCMVAGTRYEHDDPQLKKLLDSTFKVSKAATLGNPAELLLPFTKKIAPGLLSSSLRFKTFDEIHAFSKNIIDNKKLEGRYLSDPQSYIDVFLRKIIESRKDEESVYTEEQLQCMIADLLLVGSLTLNATLTYAILFLTINPDIQKKCQDEIDSIVAGHLAPTMEDIEKMPYFQAFLLEVHRCANVVPNPVPRLAPDDWVFRGHKIPKGTIILSNHYTVNKDDRIWGDANVFRPDRFINAKGDFVPDPRVVIFGFGKRICIGIHLVNSIVPLFISCVLQNFKFSVVPGTNPPTLEPEVGVSLSPQQFSVQLTLRKP